MSWMSNGLRSAVSAAGVLLLGGCFGGVSLPEQNVARVVFTQKDFTPYTRDGEVCPARGGDAEAAARRLAAVETLRAFTALNREGDSLHDAWLEASADRVELMQLSPEGACYRYRAQIAPEQQKALSPGKVEVVYYRMGRAPGTEEIFKRRTQEQRYWPAYVYTVTAEYFPGLPQTTDYNEQYWLSKYCIVPHDVMKLQNDLGYGSKIVSSPESITIFNKSFSVDPVKARFMANVIAGKPDGFGRYYNTAWIRITPKGHAVKALFGSAYGDGFAPVDESYEELLKPYKEGVALETEYTLLVPEAFKTEKLYISPLPDPALFELSVNAEAKSVNADVVAVGAETNRLGQRVIRVTLRSKRPVRPSEYKHYLSELKKLPLKVAPVKRGGLGEMQTTDFYIVKDEDDTSR